MSNCKIETRTNSQQSNLHDQLLLLSNNSESLAMERYRYMNSSAFKEKFGDWEAAYKLKEKFGGVAQNADRVDENGEPRLFLDEARNKHYVILEDNTKMYYPARVRFLPSLLGSQKREFIKALALSFIRNRMSKDFSNFDVSGQVQEDLETAVKAKINTRISQLEGSFLTKMKAKFLNKTLDHVDEIVDDIKDYYKQFNLELKEEALEAGLDEVQTRGYAKASFEMNGKNNVNSNIKLKLALMQDESQIDDTFGEAKLMEFDDIYGTLLHSLANRVDLSTSGTPDDFFALIQRDVAILAKKKPYFETLLNAFKYFGPTDRAQFVQAFNLHSNSFIATTMEVSSSPFAQTDAQGNAITDKNNRNIMVYPVNVKVMDLSTSGSKARYVKNNWSYDFYRSFVEGKTDAEIQLKLDEVINGIRGNETSTKESFASHMAAFKSSQSGASPMVTYLRANIENDKNFEEVFSRASNNIRQTLTKLGIKVEDNTFEHYLDGNSPKKGSNEVRLNNLVKLYDSVEYFTGSLTKDAKLRSSTQVFDDQTSFNDLAKADAFFMTQGTDATILTSGKTKQLFSNPSYLSTKMLKWQGNPEILKEHRNSTHYNKGSFYMKKLLGLNEQGEIEDVNIAQARINQFKLHIFNSVGNESTGETTESDDTTKMDYYADLYNKMLGHKGGGISYFNGPTPADKKQQYMFSIPKELFVDTKGKIDKNGVVQTQGRAELSEAYKILKGYVMAEYNRAIQVQQEIDAANEAGDTTKLKMHYHLGNKNGLKFQILKSLNYENTQDGMIEGVPFYDKQGRLIEHGVGEISEQREEVIFRLLQKHVTEKVKSTEKHLNDIGMIEIDGDRVVNQRFDQTIWATYVEQLGSNGRNAATAMATDIVFNGIVSNMEYAKMFTGDIAYYKNMVDYKKRVPATYTDGQTLYNDPNDLDENGKPPKTHFNVAVIQGVKIQSPYYSELETLLGTGKQAKHILKQYAKGIDSTDAQAWVTPERWKELSKGLGKWNEKTHAEVFRKLEAGETLDEKQLKIAAQPLKGVYFDNNLGEPVYLKDSEAVLIPQIVRSNPALQILSDKMKAKEIDMLISHDGSKVGGINPSITHDADGNVLPADKFELIPMSLKNEGWKLQQDLPTKGYKQTDVGSQIQKNIFEGLANKGDEIFTIGGKNMTGREVAKLLHGLTNELTSRGKSQLEREFGMDERGNISDPYKLNKVLVDELISRGASENTIESLKQGISTYGLPGVNTKIQNVFASIVLDRLVKIKTNGGSFIQMSNYGFNKNDAVNNGVVWTPWSKDKTYEYSNVLDEKGKKVMRNGKPVVRPAGVLISGSFIEKLVPNWSSMPQKELFGTLNEETGRYEGGLIDHDVLSNLIGYRIPNQGLASNDAFEVAGILPGGMGDTVIAYTSITTKTGSDFDIDKMFMMFPSIKAKRNTDKGLWKFLYNKLYEENDKFEDTIDKVYDILDQSEELSNDEALKLATSLIGNVKDKTEAEITQQLKKERDEALDDLVDRIIKNPDLPIHKELMEDHPGINVVSRIEYVKPDYSKPYSEQSKEQLQNMLIEAYKGIITDYSNIHEVVTPIDYDFIKDDVVNLAPPVDNGEFADFMYQYEVELKYDFAGGQAGIGQNANSLVNHITGKLSDLTVKMLPGFGFNLGKNVDSKSIKLDVDKSQKLSEEEIEFYIESYNKGVSDPKDKMTRQSFDEAGLDSIKVSSSLSALMNAYVDIAKDPYITRGNWTTMTANVGFTLLRAGSHPFFVNSFMAQPIIKEYIEFVEKRKSLFSEDAGDMKKAFIEAKELEEVKGDPELRTLKNLRMNMKNRRATVDKAVITGFFAMQDITKDVVKATRASKIDVNGYGKDNIGMLMYQNLYNELMNEKGSNLGGFQSMLRNESENYDKALGGYKNNLDWIKGIMNKNPLIFLEANDKVANTFNYISEGIYGEKLSNEELGSKVARSFYSYVMSSFGPISAMDNVKKADLITKMPNRLLEYKAKVEDGKVPYNEFISELNVRKNAKRDGLPIVSMSNRAKSGEYQDLLSSEWQKLLLNPDTKEFAEDLINYTFLTSGFQKNIDEFYSVIPGEWFMANNINDHIKNVVGTFSEIDYDHNFVDDFFKHNYKDRTIVRTINSTSMIRVEGYNTDTAFKRERDVKGDKLFLSHTPQSDMMGPENNVEPKTMLYKLQGYDVKELAVYTRVEPRGASYGEKGYRVYEYNSDGTVVGDIRLSDNVREAAERVASKVAVPFSTDSAELIDVQKEIQDQFKQDRLKRKTAEKVKLKEFEALPTGVMKIISGGQTGIDKLGLQVGAKAGVITGGTAPKGFKIEGGSDPELKSLGLVENNSTNYNVRTEQNVIDSDGTVYFAADTNSAGLKATENFAKKHNAPFILNPTAEELSKWLKDNNVGILNVAGNRASKMTDEQIETFRDTLTKGLYDGQPIAPINNNQPQQGTVTEPQQSKKVTKVAEGIKVIDNALTQAEEVEMFEMIKPFLEAQGSKTNQSPSAPIMIGLGLRWDYTSNNRGKTPIEIKEAINNSVGQRNKYAYYDVSINGEPLGEISDRLKELMTKATGFDASNYDGAIINLYRKNSFISAHNDVDESVTAKNYPVLVANIGGKGSLSVEGANSQKRNSSYKNKQYSDTPLESGSAYVFGEDSKNRDVFHRTVASDGKGTLPALNIQGETIPANSYRISITLRRVKDLTDGMPNSPEVTSEPQQSGEVRLENSDKVVFGHPLIGKSFLKDNNDDRFLSLDDDPKYLNQIEEGRANIISKYPKENLTKYDVQNSAGVELWHKEYKSLMQSVYEEAKRDAKSLGKTLMLSNTELLKNNLKDFDKIISIERKTFLERVRKTRPNAKYDIEAWKDGIDEIVKNADESKVINTTGYLSDLLPQQSNEVKSEPTRMNYKYNWSDLKLMPVYSEEGVNITRTRDKTLKSYENFGNMFTGSGVAGLYETINVPAAIKAYSDWLRTGSATYEAPDGETKTYSGQSEKRAWILEQIDSGKLNNQKLLYPKNLADRKQGSHGDVLITLASKKNNSILPSISQENSLTLPNESNQNIERFDPNKEFFKEKVTDSKNILETIAARNEALSPVAKKLLEYDTNVPIELLTDEEYEVWMEKMRKDPDLDPSVRKNGFGGIYSSQDHTIFIRNKRQDSNRTLIHEIVHAYTYHELRKNYSETKDFIKLYEHAKSFYKKALDNNQLSKEAKKRLRYAFSNKDEFIVALFSDSQTMNFLKTVPASKDVKKYDNLFQEIFDYILNLFGFNSETDFKLYDQAMSVASQIISIQANNYDSMMAMNEMNQQPQDMPPIDKGQLELFNFDSPNVFYEIDKNLNCKF